MNRIFKHRSQQVIALQRFLPKYSWIELVVVLIVVLMFFTQQVQAKIADATRFKLHHVTLSVSNADRVCQWYVDQLGFTISDRFTLTRPNNKQVRVIRIEIPELKINISQFDDSIPAERSGEHQGWRHLALQVDNIDQTYERLQTQGIQFLSKPFTYNSQGIRIAFLKDPEGNILELYQDL